MLRFVKVAPEARLHYLDLLLIGDEDPNMLRRYLDAGTLFAAIDETVPVGVAMVVPVDATTIELKNLAVYLPAIAKVSVRACYGTSDWCMRLIIRICWLVLVMWISRICVFTCARDSGLTQSVSISSISMPIRCMQKGCSCRTWLCYDDGCY